jgi:hypothetical protein
MVLFWVTLIEASMIGITLDGIVVACWITVERTHVAFDEHELLNSFLHSGNSSIWNG